MNNEHPFPDNMTFQYVLDSDYIKEKTTRNCYRDDDDFVGFRSLHALGIMVWTITEKESDTRIDGYKPLALLRIDLLGSLMCPV